MEINYSEIIERMKDAAGLKNDSAVARVLGVTPQALSNYKKRGRMPTSLIIKFASVFGLSVDWLLTGRGQQMPGAEKRKGYMVAKEEGVPYGKEAGIREGLDLTPLSPDEIIYVGKLLKVLRKAGSSTVTAMRWNIDAFLKATESPEKEGPKKGEKAEKEAE